MAKRALRPHSPPLPGSQGLNWCAFQWLASRGGSSFEGHAKDLLSKDALPSARSLGSETLTVITPLNSKSMVLPG